MQLVAYGAQDIYLTGNPQITFFKVVYRRHTNFAMEAIEQTFNGAAQLGQKFSCTIARNGDLLGQVFLEMDVSLSEEVKSVEKLTIAGTDVTTTTDNKVTLGAGSITIAEDGGTTSITIDNGTTGTGVSHLVATLTSQAGISGVNGSHRIGQRAIDYVEVEIGGQCIDKHYGDWMDIWAGLTYCNEKWTKWNRMVNATLSPNGSSDAKLYIPLQFWFCRNPGLALPLIALQYHEVKLNVQFNSEVKYTHTKDQGTDITQGNNGGASNLVLDTSTTGAIATTSYNAGDAVEFTEYTTEVSMAIDNCCVFCDYIFLDTDERRRFAQVSHEYLIEQVQFSNSLTHSEGDDQHELRFNHPVKELVWSVQTAANAGNNFNYFGASDADLVTTALLQLNGHDRMKKREGTYFRCVQPFQHHTGADGQEANREWGGYYCYSFGLKPEEHQPSGTCNFSRIDNAVLQLNGATGSAGTLKVYAINYNVLRIMSGMGGLAYSN